jgi:hypothetical protein
MNPRLLYHIVDYFKDPAESCLHSLIWYDEAVPSTGTCSYSGLARVVPHASVLDRPFEYRKTTIASATGTAWKGGTGLFGSFGFFGMASLANYRASGRTPVDEEH